MNTKTLFKTTLILLLLLGCSKDEDNNTFTPTLPEATQTGKNTFGCYIDGKLLTPRDGTGSVFGADHGMVYSGLGQAPNYDYNEINVQDYASGFGGLMDIHIIDLHSNAEETYNINESNCQDNIDANNNINIRCRWWNESLEKFEWYCSVGNQGSLTITRYDFENRIVSGTFNFTAQNRDDPEDIIEITNGRFDIKWDTLLDTTFP